MTTIRQAVAAAIAAHPLTPGYIPIDESEVPADVRWSEDRSTSGQICLTDYGDFGAAEAGRGSPYMRWFDQSDRSGQTYRLVERPVIALESLGAGVRGRWVFKLPDASNVSCWLNNSVRLVDDEIALEDVWSIATAVRLAAEQWNARVRPCDVDAENRQILARIQRREAAARAAGPT